MCWERGDRNTDSAVSICTSHFISEQVTFHHLFVGIAACLNPGLLFFLTPRTSIKWASETPNVERFFPSEYGTDIEHNPSSAFEKPHQLKLKVRAYAKTVPKEKLHFTYLVTGPYSDLYMGKSSKHEIGTFDVQAKMAVLLGDGNGQIAFTAMTE